MNITIDFDGLCEPTNPGGVGCIGYIIRLPDGREITKHRTLGRGTYSRGGIVNPMQMTNNVAEYDALLSALEHVEALQADGELPPKKELTILIRGDSKLVIEQICARWACNKPHLQSLRDKITAVLITICGAWNAMWVGREGNEKADALSRKAYRETTGEDPPVHNWGKKK